MSEQPSFEELKAEHDLMLNNTPEGIIHEEAKCPFCIENSYGGGDTMTKTYTEDELNAAIEAALTPVKESAAESIAELESELAELRAADEAEAAAEEAEAIEAAAAAVDAAEARAVAAEAKYDELVSYLDEQAMLAEIAEYIEAVKAERASIMADTIGFGEDHIAANIDRWVAMSDEDFAAYVDDLKAIPSAPADEASEEDSEVAETAMSHTRSEDIDTAAADNSVTDMVWGAHRSGISVARLNLS